MSVAAEQITLHSNESYSITPTEEDLSSLKLEIQQNSKLHNIQRQVKIYHSHVIQIVEKSNKRTRSYLLNLALLNDKPVHVRRLQPKYLLVALLLGILAVTTGYLKSKGLSFFTSNYVYTVIALLATGAFIAIIMALSSYKNVWVFSTARGRIPLIALYHCKPDKAQFNKFITAMMEEILLAKRDLHIPSSQLVPLEVGEHRRLSDEGILNSTQYDVAKQNILHG